MISPNRVKGYAPKSGIEKQMRNFLKKVVKHDPITQFKFENCFNYKMITGIKNFL